MSFRRERLVIKRKCYRKLDCGKTAARFLLTPQRVVSTVIFVPRKRTLPFWRALCARVESPL